MTAEEILNQLRQVEANPGAWLRRRREASGRPILGFHLTDAPEELFYAAGFDTAVITGARIPISMADAHLQSYCCSLVRSCLELELRGSLDFMSGIVIPHICDSTQQLSAIWRRNTQKPFIENFRLPRLLDSPHSFPYLMSEMKRIRAHLEAHLGREIGDDAIRSSIRLYNRNRSLIREVCRNRQDHPRSLTNRELYTVIKTSMFMPKEEHTRLVEGLLERLDGREACAPPKARVFLSGILWEPPEIMDAIQEEGGQVVGDDLYTGWRYVEADADGTLPPLEALAKRQLSRIPCACTHHPDRSRARYIIARMRETGAKGLIFLQIKFCEPEDFDFPDMKADAEAAGIKTLRLESELQAESMAQARTRLQAFFEMLS